MRRVRTPRSEAAIVMDYTAAVTRAVAWLGNRYLLATPAPRLIREERQTSSKRDVNFTNESAMFRALLRSSRTPDTVLLEK